MKYSTQCVRKQTQLLGSSASSAYFPYMFKISAKRLGKYYGKRWIFRNIDLHIHTGKLGIGGANGSGKSTLLRALAGLIRANEGEVVWQKNGEPLDRTHRKNHLGYAAPYISLYHELTLHENLMFIARVRGLLREAGPERVLAMIIQSVDQAGLTEKLHQEFSSFSSGQQQRAKLAAATFFKPDVLFLDEPGTNLDAIGTEMVRNLVQSHSGILILASNDENELKLCNQNVFLNP